MTCIVGLVDSSGGVYMGADSAGVEGDVMHIRFDRKVFTRGEMIFGFTESFRMGQLLQYKLNVPSHPKGISDHEYLVTHFVSAVTRCFRSCGFLKSKDTQNEVGTFLLGYRMNLYRVSSDFDVGIRSDGFDAVGQGHQVALGSLFSTHKLIEEPERRIQLALEASVHFNTGVRPPFKILSILSNNKTMRLKGVRRHDSKPSEATTACRRKTALRTKPEMRL